VENQSTKPSIDEQLAEANRQFDERLQAEKAAKADKSVRVTSKPQKKPEKPKRQRFQPGEVAHQHFAETETDIIEKDCLYVSHTVYDRKGFTINGTLYQGRVVVPQCVADYLQMMENRHQVMERSVFEDRGRMVNYGEVKGR
jgi:hypothetical protein